MSPLRAQVFFYIDSVPSKTNVYDTIFMASEINGWNPHDTRLAFTNRENGYELVMPYVNDTFEYKLSRGDWRKVEVDSEGKEVRNRIYYPGTDTVKIVVEGWRDTFEPIQQNSTASANVRFYPLPLK